MRKKHIDYIKPGEINGRNIYSFTNNISLLNAGIPIEAKYIRRLKEMGVGYVYVNDDISDGIEINEMIPEEVQNRANKCVHRVMQYSGEDNIDGEERNIKSVVGSILSEIMRTRDLTVNITDIRATDDYTFGHSVSVCTLSIVLGSIIGLNDVELRDLGLGAILHDIGKTKIPLEILNKPGKLIPEEHKIIKTHTTEGFEILRKCATLNRNSVSVALGHHERFDGSGYPNGIKNDEINMFCRIVSVVDAFDAMCADRVYRKGLEVNKVIRYLNLMAGKLFDGEIVRKFTRKVMLYPNGTGVVLNTEERGIVVKSNPQNPLKPVVRICYDPSGKKYKEFKEIDLFKVTGYRITGTCEI